MKDKRLTQKILLTLLLGCYVAMPGIAAAEDLNHNEQTGMTDATNGVETVSPGDTWDNVYGGKAEGGAAIKNSVQMSGGEVHGIYGGFSDSGAAVQNKVSISDGEVWYVYGGYGYGNASGNSVTIDGGDIGLVFGGNSGYGNAVGNSATIKGGNITAVYGGQANTGNVEDNVLEITGGDIGGAVGGSTYSGNATGNRVSISSAEVYGLVSGAESYGGFSEDAEGVPKSPVMKNNTATISGGTIKEDVHGAFFYRPMPVAKSASMDVQDAGSRASLPPSELRTVTLEANKAIIEKQADITGDVYGAKYVPGYISDNVNMTNNEVIISGGTIIGDVVAAFSEDWSQYRSEDISLRATPPEEGEASPQINLDGNKVTITGGTVEGNIAGGVSGIGNVTNSIMDISSTTANLNLKKATLWGGYTDSGTLSNNTLNVRSKDIEVAGLRNFDALNFYLTADTVNGDTMLRVIGGEVVPDEELEEPPIEIMSVNAARGGGASELRTDVSGAVITGYVPGDTQLKGGDTVILLNDEEGITTDGTTYYGKMREGASLIYDVEVKKQDDQNIVLTLGNNPHMNPDTKSFVETQLAGIAFLNQGANLLDITGKVREKEWEGFITVDGNKFKAKTGSHVDIDGYNLNTGIGKIIENKSGRLLIAPMFEYGKGHYDSYLNSGVHGKGDISYNGGGLLVRQENNNGVYYEGSVRGGRLRADYKSDELRTSYYSRSSYVSTHLGIGIVKDINAGNEMEYYGKFFYSHTSGDDVKLSTGETYRFDSVDSERLRLGARYRHKVSDVSNLYAGLAWECEFDGDGRAHYKDHSTASPSLRGSSGLLELGWKAEPLNGMNLDLNLSGWMGQQKGLALRAYANWTF